MTTCRAWSLMGLVLACVLATACEPPPVKPTADRNQNMQGSRIEGSVVVQSRARGNVIVLLYDAQRPPPPYGAGRPVSFTVIPMSTLFGMADAGSVGPFVAPFTFSLVAPGSYVIGGFIDSDTCLAGATPCHASDFSPKYTVTGQPNAGDVAGGAVDPTTLQPRTLQVAAASSDGTPPEATTGVTVSFSDALPALPDPPAFWVDPSLSGASFDTTTGVKLVLKPFVLRRDPIDLRTPKLILISTDATRSGRIDVWPHVLVRKVEDGMDMLDENDVDNNGVLDSQGVDYNGDGVPDRVVLDAALDQTAVDAANGAKPAGSPVAVDSLTINVTAHAYIRNPQGTNMLLPSVPHGRYAVTLIQYTGQTWRVPNDLFRVVSLDSSVPSEKSQTSGFIQVP